MQAVNSWIAKLEVAELRPMLGTLFDRYVETTIEHCRRNFKTVVPLPAISQALTVCRLLEAVLPTVRLIDKTWCHMRSALAAWTLLVRMQGAHHVSRGHQDVCRAMVLCLVSGQPLTSGRMWAAP